MNRHLAALAAVPGIRITLVHELGQGEAPIHENSYAQFDWQFLDLVSLSTLVSLTLLYFHFTCFPILPVDQIPLVQGRRRPDMRGLLAVVGHVERDATLALRLVQDFVHGVQERHRLVHFDELFG